MWKEVKALQFGDFIYQSVCGTLAVYHSLFFSRRTASRVTLLEDRRAHINVTNGPR